jgi:hypothetical protein
MNIEIKAWLYDILNAILEIDSFLQARLKLLMPTKMIQEQEEL